MNGELRLFDDEFEPNVVATPAPSAEPAPSAMTTGALGQNDDPFTVVVKRSEKRKRTVGAQLIGDVLTIVVPSWMSRAEEDHWVDVMSGRFRRKASTDRID